MAGQPQCCPADRQKWRTEIGFIEKGLQLKHLRQFSTVLLATCILVYGITPVNAQTGILSLPKGNSAIGLGFQMYDPPLKSHRNSQHRFGAQNIRGSLDYPFNRSLKISFIPGIAFLNIASRDSIDVPPSPSAELRLTATGPLDAERALDYFVRGGVRGDYTQIHSGGRALHYMTVNLMGGGGFIFKLKTATQWQFHPFFGVFYSNIWQNTSTSRQLLVNDTYNLFTGEVGVEIQASPPTHIIGSVAFSFETSEIIYNVGINFH